MRAIAAPTKEVPKGFVWRRLHSKSDALRSGLRPWGTRGLVASVLLDASLLRAFGVNLTFPQPTASKSWLLQLLRKPKNRTHAELPREPYKKRSLRLLPRCLGDQLNAADARTDGVGAASLPEPLDSCEKRHRRAEPAEGTTRENT